MKAKRVKFIDPHDSRLKMPNDIFYEFQESRVECLPNDIAVMYEVGEDTESEWDSDVVDSFDEFINQNGMSKLDSWLIDNYDVKFGEQIIIAHWW